MNNDKQVYVGESLNVEGRMRQHLESKNKKRLKSVRVVLDDTFNKSACLDLESFLIRMFHGDGQLQVLNLNAGITDAEYYDRGAYNKTFREIFDGLRLDQSMRSAATPLTMPVSTLAKTSGAIQQQRSKCSTASTTTKKGREENLNLGTTCSHWEIGEYVRNIYCAPITHRIHGTYFTVTASDLTRTQNQRI
nr:GIY-YIG nuclease family protein [Brevibacterium casei]